MEKIKKDVLGDLVYHKIKLMIHDGALKPGQKILKKELSEMLDVSQTPVRDTINRLTGEGLIEQKNREGYFIKVFTYADLKELYAVRAALEGIAIRICVEKLNPADLEKLCHLFDDYCVPIADDDLKKYLKTDQEFHKEIILNSGNSVIIDFEKNFDFILKSYQKGLIRHPDETLSEHKEIIEAIRERDAERAHELILKHHLKTRDVIKKKHLRYRSDS